MFDYNKIIADFNLDMQTSKDMLDAFQKWSEIFNGHEPWIDDTTTSLHVAKTMCEKVAKAVTIEYKSSCDEPYINDIYQKFLRNKRKNTEYMLGKSGIFFRPYFDGKKINVSSIQMDKFIPVKFNDDGDLLGCIIIDQITKESNVYTRLEYDELIDGNMNIKNIAYKGRKDGTIFESRIPLQSIDKWKDIEEVGRIEGIDRLIGGFATMPNANPIDNSSPCGVPIYYNALDTLKEIDKQYSRTLWEYEGTELAIDVDPSLLIPLENGTAKMPKRKQRLFRKLSFDEVKDKNYNVFSPEIRDTSLFNGLNEYLRQAENECGLAYGTLSKMDEIAKTATEIKSAKQDYYVTVADIQDSLQHAFDDLIYGIYVLCKLYGIPVATSYTTEHDWDDSILVDKDTESDRAMREESQGLISKVEYRKRIFGETEEIAKKKIKEIEESNDDIDKLLNDNKTIPTKNKPSQDKES